jgi:CheY-like chemotaxis protein
MDLRMAGKKILVADDSLTIQKVIRLALSGDGYEIQTVSDGKEAIEQASLFRPDICIIDVSLPKYDAYQIREKFIQAPDLKNIPVIMMSSAFEKVDEVRMHALGFTGHLVKPFDPSHLRSTLLSVSHHAPENDPVMATINSAASDEVVSMDDLPPLPPQPPKRSTGFEEFPPLSSDFHGGMDDIQELARNTFELSGLDQHDWGMIEPGRAEEPAVEAIEFGAAMMPPPPPSSNPSSFLDSEPLPMMDLGPIPPAPAAAPSISAEEISGMVRAEVSKVLEELHFQIQDRIQEEMKLAIRDLVPGLAEKIIKEEIHRLLSNPPV